jgi:hypothetical protein
MYLVGSSGNERYFARTLLTVVKGPTSFENLRTIDKRIYDTFKVACVAQRLYDIDEEWDQCMTEVAGMQTRAQLRSLFVTILTHSPLADPLQLWERHNVHLVDDCTHWFCQRGIVHPNKDQILNLTLHLIDDGLTTTMGKNLTDFGLPKPPVLLDELEMETNRLIRDQLEDNISTL